MRAKLAGGALVALALLIPAAPAMAQAEGKTGLDANCQVVERKVFKDIRTLITVDLDTATDSEVEVVATQILSEAKAEELPVLPKAVQDALKGTTEELRAFLKTSLLNAWRVDLRISVGRTMSAGGPNVKAAAQKVLDEKAFEVYLAYLNEGVYVARELDCAPPPNTTPSGTPSAPAPGSSTGTGSSGGETGGAAGSGEGGGLPLTGANAGAVAGIGGALLLLGGLGYLVGRRRRSRFVA